MAAQNLNPRPNDKRTFLIAAIPLICLGLFAVSPRLLSAVHSGDDALEYPQPRTHFSPAPHRSGPPLKPADKKTQQAIELTVGGQVAAMRRGDYAKAVTFSASGFRTNWTPPRFQSMIEAAYPALPQSQSLRFETAQVTPDQASVRIAVKNQFGDTDTFVYLLAQENGKWVVVGCNPAIPAPPPQPPSTEV